MRFLPRAALLTLVLCLFTVPARAESASDYVRALTSKALPALTDQSISDQQRRTRFRQLIDQYFDMNRVSRLVLGRYWNQATPEQQKEFERLTSAYVVSLYADRFKDFAGIKIDVGAARQEDGREIVDSVIDRGQGQEPVRLAWRVEQRPGGGHAITDMIIEGVSMVVTQRSEFASVIRQNGGKVQALIDLLRQRTAA